MGHFGLGTGASCEPDEARASQLCPAYSLYVERRWRPSNEVWRSKLAQYPAENELDTGSDIAYYTATRTVAPVDPCSHIELGVSEMTWETPTFTEVKMDAEINSYQEDSDDRF